MKFGMYMLPYPFNDYLSLPEEARDGRLYDKGGRNVGEMDHKDFIHAMAITISRIIEHLDEEALV